MSDPKSPLHATPIGVRLTQPITFGGVSEHFRLVGQNANCLSIAPARLEPDLSAVATDKGQASQGLLVKAQGKGFVSQVFVPYAMVAEVIYGPAKEEKK